jgi:hypothetical protein
MAILGTQQVKYTLYGTLNADGTTGQARFYNAVNTVVGSSVAAGGDLNTGSSLSFRVEDVLLGRVPTIRRVVFSYINTGVTTLTFTLTGTNDLGAVVTSSVNKTFGTAGLSNLGTGPFTAFVDINLTAFQPQLSITRASGANGFLITNVLIVGTIEDQTL